MNIRPQGNDFEEFYENTFDDIFENYRDRITVIGKKIFFKVAKDIIVTAEFTGPVELSYVNLTCSAITKNGLIDITEIQLKKLFFENKFEGVEKTVQTKIKTNSQQTEIIWSTEITEEDKRKLNETLEKYISVFRDL